MYLPKIHKAGCPLHSIVNTVSSPTYDISKYLERLLRPHLGHIEAFVQNSTILAIEKFGLTPQDLLVSLDVMSLFTRVLCLTCSLNQL